MWSWLDFKRFPASGFAISWCFKHTFSAASPLLSPLLTEWFCFFNLSSFSSPSPASLWMSSCRWPTCYRLPRCPNRMMLKDATDSSKDEDCYGHSRCHTGHLQELGSGAADRWVIIIAVKLFLIRASLVLFLILSFCLITTLEKP